MSATAKQPSTELQLSDQRLAQINTHLTQRMARQFRTRRGDADLAWDTEKQYAFAILKANDFTMDYAVANPESVGIALLDLADLGLSLSPARRHAYLVPRKVGKNKVPTVIGCPSYIGMEAKALDSGAVTLIQSNLVYSRDTFEVWTDETGRHLKHVEARGERGTFECVYTLAKFANGETHVETMTPEHLQKCWDAAVKANNGQPPMIGKDWIDEWRKKCCVRRAWKHWPSTPQLAALQEAMDKADPMEFGEPEERVQESGPCLTKEHIDELLALIPNTLSSDPEKLVARKEQWLLMLSQAIGFNGIRDVPITKFDDMKARIAQRVAAMAKAS